jgi:hypothetical protein
MSKYLDNNEMFLEPTTNQYGSHMVMTNVMKPTKTKYINIDTRFRDEYSSTALVNYTVTLPERINDVKSVQVSNVEIPNTIYNISSNNNNNIIKIVERGEPDVIHMIVLPDDNYDSAKLISTLSSKILQQVSTDLNIEIDTATNKCKFSTSSQTNEYTIEFAVDSTGSLDKHSPRSKLGWLLGFRNITYILNKMTTPIVAESFVDLNGSRYLYLAIDEFSKGNQNSFLSPLSKSFINKNILARISNNLINSIPVFGSVNSANRRVGTLVSDHRRYTGKTDLQKLNIQLLNEYGNPVDLNGMDFSFCLEVEYE